MTDKHYYRMIGTTQAIVLEEPVKPRNSPECSRPRTARTAAGGCWGGEERGLSYVALTDAVSEPGNALMTPRTHLHAFGITCSANTVPAHCVPFLAPPAALGCGRWQSPGPLLHRVHVSGFLPLSRVVTDMGWMFKAPGHPVAVAKRFPFCARNAIPKTANFGFSSPVWMDAHSPLMIFI